jgi:membrane associated rhomboid family serine protease
MFFPYKDDNPTSKLPLLTWLLIAANLWVFVRWQLPLPPQEWERYFFTYGFVPNAFFGDGPTGPIEGKVWEWTTIYTSMFSHGGIAHLLGNMLFLYLFGDNVEDAMGKVRFLLFYLTCGTAAALAQGFVAPGSNVPMVGASGAISGVIAGYLLLYPRANVRVFYWFFIFVGTLFVPAWAVLGLWVVEQALALPASMKAVGGVAVVAHLGGFAAGFALTPFFKKPEVPLLQKPRTRAFSRQGRRIR